VNSWFPFIDGVSLLTTSSDPLEEVYNGVHNWLGPSFDLPTLKLVTFLQDDLGIDQFILHRLLIENLSCGVQNVFNIWEFSCRYSISVTVSMVGFLGVGLALISFGGLMDVQCLLSINLSKTFLFLISTSLWISEGLRGLIDLLGTIRNKEIIKIRLRRHERAYRADDPAWLTNERGD
jgi:hypothetical protein